MAVAQAGGSKALIPYKTPLSNRAANAASARPTIAPTAASARPCFITMPGDVVRVGANGNAHADFAGSARDREGYDPVEADGGEQRAKPPKRGGEHGPDPFRQQ